MKNIDFENFTATRILSRIKYFCLVTISLLIATGVSIAQQRGVSSENKADQTLKSSARVNPTTLAMELSLPLGAYPGRNGNSLPVTLTYSSKLWESKVIGSTYYDSAGTLPTRTIYDYTRAQFMFSRKNHAGWNISLQPPRIVKPNSFFLQQLDPAATGFTIQQLDPLARILEEIDIPEGLLDNGASNVTECMEYVSRAGSSCSLCWTSDPSIPMTESCTTRIGGGSTSGTRTHGGGFGTSPNNHYLVGVRRVMVQMPDGSVVEFRKDDKVSQCGFGVNTINPCFSPSEIGGTYLSVDNSKMRWEKNEVQPNGQTRDVLYLPDGSRFLFPFAGEVIAGYLANEAVEFVDADGNRMTFDRSTRSWSDTIGRQIVNPFSVLSLAQDNPTVAETQTVNLPSLSGSNRQAQLVWKNLKTPGCELDTSGGCGESVLENPMQELRYIGSDAGWVNDTYQPALFRGRDWTDTSIPQITKVYKENVVNTEVSPTRFNPAVLAEVNLPNGKKYEFKYNVFGEISRIKYPTGAVERFIYDTVPPLGFDLADTFDKVNRGVVERKVYSDEQSETSNDVLQNWRYEVPNLGPTKIIAPDGSYTLRAVQRSADHGYGFSDSTAGVTLSESVYSAPDSTGQSRLASKTLTEWTQDGPLPGGFSEATRNPRPLRTISMIFEGDKILATMTETDYETPGENGSAAPSDPSYFARLNPIQTKSYHYLPISSAEANQSYHEAIVALKNKFHTVGQVASVSRTKYLYDANYKARGIPSLPIESLVKDNTGNLISKTQTIYDNQTGTPSIAYPFTTALINYGIGALLDCSTNPSITRMCWQDPVSSYRGHPTTSQVWNSDTQTWIESHIQYDQFGNVAKIKDPMGNEASTEFSAEYRYAYPTKTISPAPDPTNTTGTNQTSQTTTTYDFNTGLPLTVTDDFGQTIKTEYNDPLLRPTKVLGVNVTIPITETIYDDANLTVKVRKQIDETNWDEATTYMDSLGRPIKSRSKDSQGDVVVETKYDNMGRVKQASNPFRVDANGNPTEPVYWSKPRYDELGRTVETFAPALEGQAGASLGITQFGISTVPGFIGTYTIATDASGRRARSITNALGQLIRIDEPTANTGTADQDLGTLDAPNQPTFYKYNPQGKMVRVQQGVQNRYFLYDFLGRLIRVRQPEQDVNTNLTTTASADGNTEWTAAFEYDVVGNLITTRDAKGTTITNTYDNAGRVKTRTYSNEPAGILTPQVEYFYDGKGLPAVPQFSKGKLTRVVSSISASENTSFDNFGRVLTSQQITDGRNFVSKYKYNLSGALIEQTYPSGKIVRNFLESDGDLARIAAQGKTFASDFGYFPTGVIEKLKLGNGLWESAKLNTRQQVEEIALGISPTDGSKWKVNYKYGELNLDGTVNIAKNTGNIAMQTISFNGLAQPFVQKYKYDALDRITEARETLGDSPTATQTWIQTFGYDRFGNRIARSQTIGSTTLAINSQTLPSIDPGKNRFMPGQGFAYDETGNIVQDSVSGSPRTFTFNGDNKQIEVKNSTGVPIGKYLYDADGKRVKKIAGSETTIFVYDGMGKLVAEYSTTAPTSQTISYTATDTLGSPRVITDKTGNVISRRDFLPFGEELNANSTTNRTEVAKYAFGSDNIRKRFTGYEKDQETQLDFAEARYYNNAHGRFTAVDPLLASGKSANPQSFNRYIYTFNNPLVHTDPTGLQVGTHNGDVYYKVRNGQWMFSDRPGDGYRNQVVSSRKRQVVGVDGYEYTVSAFGWTRGRKVAPAQAAVYQSRTEAKRKASGYVNQPLINGLATESVKKATTVAIATAAAVPVGVAIGTAPITVPIAGSIAASPAGPPLAAGGALAIGVAASQLSTTGGYSGGDPNSSPTPSPSTSPTATPTPSNDLTVYRVFGGESPQAGYSWTPINPMSVCNYRDVAGLPPENSGEFLVQGDVSESDIILERPALPLGPNQGGLSEMIIDPTDVRNQRVRRVSPPF